MTFTSRRLSFAMTMIALVVAMTAGSHSATAQQASPFGAVKSWGYQLTNLDPAALAASPYDALVIDYSRDGSHEQALTPADLAMIKRKPDGSRRFVLAYLSIGEAESYRYYWQKGWDDLWFIPNVWSKPAWRAKLNGDWGGNYAVRYWEPEWQQIILGDGGYLDRIVRAGFDGVWLDKVDSSLEDVASGRPSAKADMIAFVKRIGDRGRAAKPGFLVVPQNGEPLLTDSGYRASIDGFGKESLLFGEEGAGKANSAAFIAERSALLKQLTAAGKPVLAVEYLDDRATIDAARKRHADLGFVPHFANRELGALRVGDYTSGSSVASANNRWRGEGGALKKRWLLLAGLALAALAYFFVRRWRKAHPS